MRIASIDNAQPEISFERRRPACAGNCGAAVVDYVWEIACFHPALKQETNEPA